MTRRVALRVPGRRTESLTTEELLVYAAATRQAGLSRNRGLHTAHQLLRTMAPSTGSQAARLLIAQGRGGRIVNLASDAAFEPALRQARHAASKAGIVVFSRDLRMMSL